MAGGPSDVPIMAVPAADRPAAERQAAARLTILPTALQFVGPVRPIRTD